MSFSRTCVPTGWSPKSGLRMIQRARHAEGGRRLKDVGPAPSRRLLGALPDADKAATMAFVEVLRRLVSRRHSHNHARLW